MSQMSRVRGQPTAAGTGRGPEEAFDVVVVGAGLAGLYMLHRLRGLGLSARVYETGDDVGGTWYWNRYPGARCDVESVDYSYSLLRRGVALRSSSLAPSGDVPSGSTPCHCTVKACLRPSGIPAAAGAGRTTPRSWRSSNVSRRAAHESRPGYVVERGERSALEVTPEERDREYERRWAHGGFGFTSTFADLLTNKAANDTAAAFHRARIRAIVRDPAIAELLAPKDHPVGTKRLPLDTDYYETYNRDNVTLVDIRTAPIEAITPTGLRTRDAEYALDDIVFATGFDALTGPLFGIDIRGRGGRTLREKWAAGPRTYLGIASAGFPNLFMITGPGSPSVLSNMIVSIEQHVDWVADCLTYLRKRGLEGIEATVAAEDAWVEHVNEVASTTLYPLANSWYMGANIPGKPRVFMPYVGGVGRYRKTCDEVAVGGYAGFTLTAS